MSSSRFIPNNFQYNGQIALALGPCLLVAAVIGGTPVMAALAIGGMISYMMDTLQYREGAFTCSWFTLVATFVTFIVSLVTHSQTSVLLKIGLISSMAAVCILTGMWISLQFKWIQMQYPAVAIVFERVLVTGAIPMSAIMHSIAMALLIEAADVPFFLAASLCILYYHLGRPLTSSFSPPPKASAIGGGRSGGLGQKHSASSAALISSAIQNRFDGFLVALLTITLPGAMYVAVHWALLLNHILHLYSLLLLFSVPALVLIVIPNGLWWIPGPPKVLTALRMLLLMGALGCALVGFEGRVVFFAFKMYIKLHPPWDWVAVTTALMGLGAAAWAHQGGLMGRTVDVTVAGTLMLLSTTAGSLAAGVPFNWLPAPLTAACGLALYYDSSSLREYAVFVGGAAVTASWFVWHNFWFLDIDVGSVHLRLLCVLLLVALGPALLLPGLVAGKSNKMVIGAMLMLQASLLCVLEEKLYTPSHMDNVGGESMYPSYLVLATSGAGLVVTRWLQGSGLIDASSSWVIYSLHLAKLSMLVLPEAYLLLPAVLLVLASSAPLFLYGGELQPGGVAIRRRIRLAPWQGLLHLLSILLAVAGARFAIFDLVQFLGSSRPSEGILMGALILTVAGALAPLVLRCYSSMQLPLRLLVLLAMTGAAFMFLQPPMPIRGGSRCPRLPLSLCPRLWDERHVPMHGTEDSEMWGRGMISQAHWPRWLLFAACIVGTAATLLGGQAVHHVLARMLCGIAGGVLVGMYLAREVVPAQLELQILVVITCCLVVAFVVLLQVPGAARVPGLLPMVFSSWIVVLGITMLLQTELPLPVMDPENRRLFPDDLEEVQKEDWLATRASLLGVFASHALLMAFTLKLKVSSTLRHQEGRLAQDGHDQSIYGAGRIIAAADLFCGIMPSQVFARFSGLLQMRGANSIVLQRLSREGLIWVPVIGNICTAIAFLIAVSLNFYITDGSPIAIFMISPLLLLLSQDPLILTELEDKQRYWPPVAAITAFLTVAGILEALENEAAWVKIIKVLLMICSYPNHVMFLKWLWSQKPMSGAAVLGFTPLTALPLIIGWKFEGIRYLAFVAIAMAFGQFIAMRHIRGLCVKII